MKKLVTSTLVVSMLIAPVGAFAYEVERGDTMSEIAERNKVSLDELSKVNPQIKDLNLIYVGQELNLPGEVTKKDSIPVKPQKVPSKVEESKKETKKAAVEEPKKKSEGSYTVMTVTATAYTAYCEGCSGITATGIDLRSNPNQKVIAVDPRIIPLGSKVYVEGYGMAVAGDTGGAIKGNRIDIYMPSHSNAIDFGRKSIEIKVYK